MPGTELGIPLGFVVLHGDEAHLIPQERTGGLNHLLVSSHPPDSTVVHAVNLLVHHGRVRVEFERESASRRPLRAAIWAIPQDTWSFTIVPKNVRTAYFQMLAQLCVPQPLFRQQQQEVLQEHHVNSTLSSSEYTQVLHEEMSTRLLDIYLQMPSPSADPTGTLRFDDGQQPIGLFGETTSQLLDACMEMDSPEGMKTKLYEYQKRSLHKMVRRELMPEKMFDPAFVPLHDRNHQPYILNLSENAFGIYTRPPFEWDDVRGGILCEDMGTGKTCICIALILHTRYQISLPPTTAPSALVHCDIYPITQSSVVDLENNQLVQSSVVPGHYGVPTLVDVAASVIKRHGVQYSEDIIGPYLAEKLGKFPAYTLERPLSSANQGSTIRTSSSSHWESRPHKKTRRRNDEDVCIKVYLSSTTLVIVPANLIDQWCFELNKHTYEHALEVLVIPENSNKSIPPPETLIKQDIVLISQSRFSREYDSGAFVKILASKRRCTCDASITFATCRCPTEHTISPLQHVRWKRIIVDEGHSMGSQSSNYALLASAMFAERRWICTGTPTQNLSNLTTDYYQSPSSNNNDGGSSNDNKGTHESGMKHKQRSVRSVVMSDQEDLVRLSTIVSNYLRLEPFASQSKLFSKELQTPFSSPSVTSNHANNGSHDNSIGSLKRRMCAARLRRLMDTVMVRNRPVDIMADISLPPLFEKVVRLPFGYFQALTHNCQVGLIHANAVLSEREGIDYFFHPKNTKHLRQVISNLQQSCFWFSGGSGDEVNASSSISSLSSPSGGKNGTNSSGPLKLTGFVYQVQEALSNVKKGLEKDRRRREMMGVGAYPTEDVELLEQIVANLEHALHDTNWTKVIQLDNMAYFCRKLPRILQPCRPSPPFLTPSASQQPALLSAGTKEDWHSLLSEEDLEHSYFTAQQPSQGRYNDSSSHFLSVTQAHICMVNATQVEKVREEIAKQESGKESMLPALLKSHGEGQPKLPPPPTPDTADMSATTTEGSPTVDILELQAALTRERLSQATIVSSASSKLNYIVSRILLVHPTEKTIVFCEHPNAVYDLYHYLLMAKIRCLLYLRHMSLSQRSKNIMTFNTSENVSVFIMDTRAGAAYGIDLSAASRIYFVSPPFHTALERQAVKRAHRIGQQRPVFVETLVIQDSFEEAVLERRREEDDFGNDYERGAESRDSSTIDGSNSNANGEEASSPSSAKQKQRLQESRQVFGRTIEKDGKMRETISRVRFISLQDSARVIRPLSYYATLGSNDGTRFSTVAAGESILTSTTSNNDDGQVMDKEIPVVFPKTAKQLETQRLAEQMGNHVHVEEEEDETEHDGRHGEHWKHHTPLPSSSNSSGDTPTTAATTKNGNGSSSLPFKKQRVTFSLSEPEMMEFSSQDICYAHPNIEGSDVTLTRTTDIMNNDYSRSISIVGSGSAKRKWPDDDKDYDVDEEEAEYSQNDKLESKFK